MPSINQHIYCIKSNLWENYHSMEDLDPTADMGVWVINITRKKYYQQGSTEIVKYYLARISKRMALSMSQMKRCETVNEENYRKHEEYYKGMLNELCNVVIQIRLNE